MDCGPCVQCTLSTFTSKSGSGRVPLFPSVLHQRGKPSVASRTLESPLGCVQPVSGSRDCIGNQSFSGSRARTHLVCVPVQRCGRNLSTQPLWRTLGCCCWKYSPSVLLDLRRLLMLMPVCWDCESLLFYGQGSELYLITYALLHSHPVYEACGRMRSNLVFLTERNSIGGSDWGGG